jgi:hypothetical protein
MLERSPRAATATFFQDLAGGGSVEVRCGAWGNHALNRVVRRSAAPVRTNSFVRPSSADPLVFAPSHVEAGNT